MNQEMGRRDKLGEAEERKDLKKSHEFSGIRACSLRRLTNSLKPCLGESKR